MAKVSLHIIKDWFRNQQKPPQEKFWAWLDSFWHKDEPIPQGSVENLTTTLQRKADLVNGKVPESQLPFSVVTSEVIALGIVEIVGNTLTLNVHSSGSNRVRVKGQDIARVFPNSWDFVAVQNGGVKVLRGYAVKGQEDFFLAEGPELPEYEKPEIPEGALQLFEATVTEFETSIDTGEGGTKTRADDAWKTILFNRSTPRLLVMDEAGSNFILEGNYAATIAGVVAKTDTYIWEGKQFIIRNMTGNDIQLDSSSVVPDGSVVQLAWETATVLKKDMDALVMVRSGALAVIRFGGGGNAEFPEGGNVGDPLVRTGAGVEFSGAIPAAIEAVNGRVDAEEVNRAAADLQEKNERVQADADERAARIAGDAGLQDTKMDKPTADGVYLMRKNGSVITYEDASGLFVHQITLNATTNITTNSTDADGRKQHGRNVKINNGVSAITITCEASSDANFVASYTKLGAGAVTFVAGTGTTLTQLNYTKDMNGGKGSYALLERTGNEFLLTIHNV